MSPVLRIWIRIQIRIQRIHLFLGLLDSDPLVRGMDPDPALDLDLDLFDFLSLKNDVNVPLISNMQKNFFCKLVFCWRLEGQ